MKFSGLIHEGCAWPPDQPIGLTFETVKELQQHHTNYIQNGQLVCRTHRDARPGQQITIQIELPNRDRFTVKGVIEKVKDQAGKPYTLSLLRLGPLGRTQRRQIADSLTYQDDVASHPSRSETPTDTPSPPSQSQGNYSTQAVKTLIEHHYPENEQLIDIELPEELQGASGDILMPKIEGVDLDPDLEHKKWMVAFIVAFTKSIQRSSYYADSDHPEAIRAKRGIYSMFRKVIGEHREIGFVCKSSGAEKDLLIDGVLNNMLSLRDLMPRSLADLYIPKFIEYMERRHLIAFSIRRLITEAKYNQFIDLLSEFVPVQSDNASGGSADLTKTLAEKDILEVSSIFDEDLVVTDRDIPWQVTLTLSRLRKDLKTLPYLRHASDLEILNVRADLFRHTLHPIKNAEFILELLQNSDLILADMQDAQGLFEFDVPKQVIASLRSDLLIHTSDYFIEIVKENRQTATFSASSDEKNTAQTLVAYSLDIIQQVLHGLLEPDNESNREIIENLFKENLISPNQLPDKVRQRLAIEKLSDGFIHNADTILSSLTPHLSGQEFGGILKNLGYILPNLIAEQRTDLIARMIKRAHRFRQDRDVERQTATARFFDRLIRTGILDAFKEALLSEFIKERDLLVDALLLLSIAGQNTLLDVLEQSDHIWVRKRILRSFQAPQPGLSILVGERLEDGMSLPWYFVRNSLLILSCQHDTSYVKLVLSHLKHDHPRVREQAIQSLLVLDSTQAEAPLIRLLDDPDSRVREATIHHLGILGSRQSKVCRRYLDIVEGKVTLENQVLKIPVLHAIKHIPTIDQVRKNNLEGVLIGDIERLAGLGWRGLIKTEDVGSTSVEEGLTLATIEALGVVAHTPRAMKLLKKLAKTPSLKITADTAIKTMKERPQKSDRR